MFNFCRVSKVVAARGGDTATLFLAMAGLEMGPDCLIMAHVLIATGMVNSLSLMPIKCPEVKGVQASSIRIQEPSPP